MIYERSEESDEDDEGESVDHASTLNGGVGEEVEIEIDGDEHDDVSLHAGDMGSDSHVVVSD